MVPRDLSTDISIFRAEHALPERERDDSSTEEVSLQNRFRRQET
jgi:hypothetical protein